MLLGSNNQGESTKHTHITKETKLTKKDSRERHRPGVCTKARYGMLFSWPHYMTWSFAADCTLVTVNKTYPLNIKLKKKMQSAIPDLDVMEWPCPLCWVHHPACPNRLTWCLVQRPCPLCWVHHPACPNRLTWCLVQRPCPLCWVHHPACPNGLTWCLVQRNGQGLDHFKLYNLDICPMGHRAESAICNLFSLVCYYCKHCLIWGGPHASSRDILSESGFRL